MRRPQRRRAEVAGAGFGAKRAALPRTAERPEHSGRSAQAGRIPIEQNETGLECMDGSIEVDAEKCEGTRFTAWLPAEKPRPMGPLFRACFDFDPVREGEHRSTGFRGFARS